MCHQRETPTLAPNSAVFQGAHYEATLFCTLACKSIGSLCSIGAFDAEMLQSIGIAIVKIHGK